MWGRADGPEPRGTDGPVPSEREERQRRMWQRKCATSNV